MSNPIHIAKLNEGRIAWNQWRIDNPLIANPNLANEDFIERDFTGYNFEGVIFSASEIMGANFSGANLSGANLTAVDGRSIYLIGAAFDGGLCQNANFDKAFIQNMDLTACNCTNATFRDASLFNLECDQAILTGSNMDLSAWANVRHQASQLVGVLNLHTRRIFN